MVNTKKIVSNSKGFTLIELIVVITILAILGTIGFVSMQDYTKSARDSQRTSDVNQISTSIQAVNAKNATSYISMVSGNTSILTGQIAGYDVTTLSGTSDYAAGNINYTAIGVDGNKFIDPQTKASYKIGATTKKGGNFEVAASLEATKTALVTGNYKQRDATNTATVLSKGTTTIYLTGSDLGKFFVGDIVGSGGTWSGTVSKVIQNTSSGIELTIAIGGSTTLGTGTLTLSGGSNGVSEIGGLVGAVSSAGLAYTGTQVTNGTTNLPYVVN